jgi:predicted nucleotidyltransferase
MVTHTECRPAVYADEEVLRHQRFVISESSALIIEQLGNALPKIRDVNPAIQGFSVLGSHTRGQQTPASDFDYVVVFDSTIDSVWNRDQATLSNLIYEGLPTLPQPGISPVPIDIANHHIMDQIRLLDTIRVQLGCAGITTDDITTNETSLSYCLGLDLSCDLFGLFYYAVGQPVYRARSYVLDTLSTHAQGDSLLRILMGQLQSRERLLARQKNPQTPLYQHFPDTIDSARSYFQLAGYSGSPDNPELSEPTPRRKAGHRLRQLLIADGVIS